MKISKSIKTFNILLDNSTSIYTPGSLLTGQVVLDLLKPKSFRALKLRFKGKCKVRWTGNSSGSGKNTQTEGYTGREQYFDNELLLYEKKSGSEELSTGLHNFRFNFQLLHNIPSSFEHNNGFVRYTITAIIDRPWKTNYEITTVFRVETSLRVDSSSLLQGIEDEISENLCCKIVPCIRSREIELRFRLPKSGYICGDYIKATIDIGTCQVKKLKLMLEQTLLFHSRKLHKKKCITSIITETIKEGPFAEDIKEIIELRVPIVPGSRLEYCNLIDIDYKLIFYAEVSNCNYSIKRKYDIFIGSGSSALLSQQQVINYPPNLASTIVPSAPNCDSNLILSPPLPLVHEQKPILHNLNLSSSCSNTSLNPVPQPMCNIGFIYPYPSAPVDPTLESCKN
ncbi:arrestin domain-containing protein 3-like [Chelonus insularis]|uniref:arrestin domain-containing protein 3-like n=1 Tax=Chelonus insularis TaxID=460826 RepID=UPI00158A8E42|nr:arrestin domain-containing protein 3-like [Chelonus insularis]